MARHRLGVLCRIDLGHAVEVFWETEVRSRLERCIAVPSWDSVGANSREVAIVRADPSLDRDQATSGKADQPKISVGRQLLRGRWCCEASGLLEVWIIDESKVLDAAAHRFTRDLVGNVDVNPHSPLQREIDRDRIKAWPAGDLFCGRHVWLPGRRRGTQLVPVAPWHAGDPVAAVIVGDGTETDPVVHG